jgi:DNA-binding transcriptional ArsR family regulator
MESFDAIPAFAALAQETRLAVFRRLVTAEPTGLPAGDLARFLAIPANTMSAHLAILTRAGLITARRDSRSIIYRADVNRLRALTLFLIADCCGGNAEICAPLLSDLIPCCPGA